MMQIELRPITPEDTSKIVGWRNQDWVLQYFLDQRKINEESHMQYYHSRIETGLVRQWIIKADEKEIGTCFLRDIDYEKGRAEYGVFIGEKDYISKGIGKQCVRKVVKIAFEEMGLNTVFARVQEKNPRSVYSFLNTGFHMMDHTEYVEIDGRQEKVVFLEITRKDLCA